MKKRFTLRRVLLVVLAGILIFAAYECYSPWMSPEKFMRNTYIKSLDPPEAKYPTHATIVARVSNRYDFYQSSGLRDGERVIGIDLADFKLNAKTTDGGAYLPRSYFFGKKVAVRRFVIYTETSVGAEDLRVVQKILQRKPFDAKALKEAPLTENQKVLVRFFFFDIPEEKNVTMRLAIKAKPKKVTVRVVDPARNIVEIFVSTEIVAAEPFFEPADRRPPRVTRSNP